MEVRHPITSLAMPETECTVCHLKGYLALFHYQRPAMVLYKCSSCNSTWYRGRAQSEMKGRVRRGLRGKGPVKVPGQYEAEDPMAQKQPQDSRPGPTSGRARWPGNNLRTDPGTLRSECRLCQMPKKSEGETRDHIEDEDPP